MAIPLGIFSGRAFSGNFFAGGSGGGNDAYAIERGSQKSIFTTTTQGSGDVILMKRSSDGNLVWQTQVAAGSLMYQSLVTDFAGNLYSAGQTAFGAGTSQMIKWNSDGVIQWQKQFSGPAGSNVVLTSLSLNNNDAMYLSGSYTPSGGSQVALLLKVTVDGAISWQRTFSNITSFIEVSVGGFSDDAHAIGSNGQNCILVKVSSTGTLVWTRTPSVQGSYQQVKMGYSGDVYLAYVNSTETTVELFKINSSGTLTWQRTVSGAATKANGIGLDGSENVLLLINSGATVNRPYSVVYNSSGTIQTQRQIGTNGTLRAATYMIGTTNYIYGGGFGVSNFMNSLAVLPADGSKTGTYAIGDGNVTYAVSSLSQTSGTATLSTTAATIATITAVTVAASSFSVSVPTLTNTVVDI